MAETTNIEWADATLNHWIGCTEVSNGEKGACTNCYARTWAARWPKYRGTWGAGAPRVKTQNIPAKVRALEKLAIEKLAKTGEPFFCFCNSLSDIFDKEVPIEWLAEAFEAARASPHVTYLFLTKRPQNIVKRFIATFCEPGGSVVNPHAFWPPNIAIGCTVVTQEEADRDVPHLLMAAAALKPAFTFLSMEPLLGPVDLTSISTMRFSGAEVLNALTGELRGMFGDPCLFSLPKIGWVITGGESGPKARPSHPDSFRSIRDQCSKAGTAYMHKQNGEWMPCAANDGGWWPVGEKGHTRLEVNGEQTYDGWPMQKVGKTFAGRLLDGVEHNARPKVLANV